MRMIRNSKVAVVGGAGFLGSHLVDHLIDDRGCEVWVIDNLSAGRREFVYPKAYFVHHDITLSEGFLKGLFSRNGIEWVFNYAAMPYVPDSYARPLRVCEVNFFGALQVINAAQEAGCRGILQVSSAEVYGDAGSPKHEGKISEEDEVCPRSSYGASKAAIDALCQVRWREAETPVIALRQFNCVGERETHPYVVPEIISQLHAQLWREVRKGRAVWLPRHVGAIGVVKLGNNSFRDFIYAGDAVRIAVELLERGQFGEVYNLGSEVGIKVYDLAKLIGKLMGFAEVRVEEDAARKRAWEIWHLQSDNTKLWNAIGPYHKERLKHEGKEYEATVPLEEALQRTIRWFEEQGRRWPWERN